MQGMERLRRTFSIASTTIAGIYLLMSATAQAQYLTVYGGPTGDSQSDTGYLQTTGFGPGNGIQVSTFEKYVSGTDKGFRPVRWDISGAATELGNLGTDPSGYTTIEAYATNISGAAAGYGEKYVNGVDLGTRAVKWNASSTIPTELGNLGTNTNGSAKDQALGINSQGISVGSATKYSGGVFLGGRAVRWSNDGVPTELGTIGTNSSGSTDALAYAVNEAGTAVGYAVKFDASGKGIGHRAVRWDGGGTTATELDTLGTAPNGFINSEAQAVNAVGTAVGFAYIYGGPGPLKGYRAVRWDASTTSATELGDLGTDDSGSTTSQAYAVSDSGVAVGYATKYVAGNDEGRRAVRWDAGSSVVTELGNLGTDPNGVTTTLAVGINKDGIAVGDADAYSSAGVFLGERAVMWTAGTANALDLNSLIDPASGWNLETAIGINADHWILGIGANDPDGPGPLPAYDRPFLMQVPEPLSTILLGIGALTMVLRRRSIV